LAKIPLDRLLAATSRAERTHFWFRGFRRFVRPLLARAAAGRTGLALLDCGCGTGANLALLGEFGRACGVDLTWLGLEHARGQGHGRIAQASVTDLPFLPGRFDIVTSFDVLYCLEDEHEARAIAEMRRVLKPGGAAIINVAALELLKGTHGVVLGGEVRRYTAGLLRRSLERGGFRPERLTYTNFSIFPIVLPVRLAQRLTGMKDAGSAELEISVPPAPVNATLSALLAIEARMVQHVNMPIGSSVLCLARRV
jgi:SAM-dependent methyltransferase